MRNLPKPEQLKRIPMMHEVEERPLAETEVCLHFWLGDSDWYITAYDGDDIFFGFSKFAGMEDCAEWGDISFQMLKDLSVRGHISINGEIVEIPLEVETDWYWTIRPAKEVDDIQKYGLA